MLQLSDRYSVDDFASLIARETDRVELKTGTGGGPLQEALVSFSNTEGGIIFIGVRDDRTVVGRRLDQGTEDKIHEAAASAYSVGRYKVGQVMVGETFVVAVTVHRRAEGFSQTSDGRILVRRGARNVFLVGQDAFEFISSRALIRFERTTTGLPQAAADPDLIAEVAIAHGWEISDSEILTKRLLERGLLTQTSELTFAGALVLTDPEKALGLAKAVVEIRRYSDDGFNYDRRVVLGGPAQQQVRDATNFVVEELGSDLVVAGLYRYELPKLPEVVVREAIANAVSHRSYELDRVAIVVDMRPDRVTVTSPGRLPEPVTVRTLRQGQSARNPTLISVLRRLHLAEDAGRGVDVMEDTMQQELLDPPQFSEGDSSFQVTLPLRGPITPRERGWIADLERRGELQITDRLLLVHAARGEKLTNTQARQVLGVDSGVARQALQRLRDAGLLEQHGERGGASYTLAESIAPPAVFRMTQSQLEDLVLERAGVSPLSNEVVRSVTGLDRAAVRALLRHLVQSGRLLQVGERRGTRYRLPGT